jgi:2-polyprenyl-3-methyl-5-hydroxy-6-metoxy-1,4-benzoquinol methylase
LPNDCRRVLELGCGTGATGAAAKAANPDLEWIGIEMVPDAADAARTVLDSVYEGDVADIPPETLGRQFDAIVASEVLEHLVDPWQVVAALSRHLRPGGVFIASTPNVASRHVIAGLLKGRFDYSEEGVMDRTHLRWFTPVTFARMFAQAGLAVERCEPVEPLRAKARLLDRMTGGRLRHLFHNQIVLVARRD